MRVGAWAFKTEDGLKPTDHDTSVRAHFYLEEISADARGTHYWLVTQMGSYEDHGSFMFPSPPGWYEHRDDYRFVLDGERGHRFEIAETVWDDESGRLRVTLTPEHA